MPRHRRSYRVLLADDDALTAETITALLDGDRRFELVGRARDGREAVELTEALHPDVVLMDIAMPVMDGIQATGKIHARHPRTPVVIVSGTDYADGALEARYAGAVDYVRKGRLTEDLTDALVAAVRGKRPVDVRRAD